jgi:hypothetical protein
MILHIFRIRFKDNVSAEKRAELIAYSDRMRQIKSIRSVVSGYPLSFPQDACSHAMVLTLDDEDAYRDYLNDPIHFDLERVGLPYVESVSVFDLVDPADTDLPARLAKIRHERRERMAG